MKEILLTICSLIVILPIKLMAQESSVDIDSIASEIEKGGSQRKKSRGAGQRSSSGSFKYSDLTNLANFEDVSVLQRRFQPKTKRFHLYGMGTFVTNDAFFLTSGFGGRIGYSFRENIGFELTLLSLNSSEKDATKDLRNGGVSTGSLLTPKGYTGIDFMWTPIFGKMSLLNKSIVPFDVYFQIGAGTTSVLVQDYNYDSVNLEYLPSKTIEKSAPTIHFGTGQIFAITRSVSFRWDFSLNNYALETKDEVRASTNSADPAQVKKIVRLDPRSSAFNNLFLNFGVSIYFPGAGGR